MSTEKVTIKSVAYQRNGISGRSFYHVFFAFEKDGQVRPNMIAIVPSSSLDNGHSDGVECYVVNADDHLSCWRGDHFLLHVKEAIEEHQKALWKGLRGMPKKKCKSTTN